MKRIVWLLLIILGIIIAVGGCARWPNGPEPGPDEPEYQLEITVEVAGEINSDDGIYYIVLDADGNPADGPGDDISFWDDRFYYIKLESDSFYFAQKEEGSSEMYLTSSSIGEKKFQVTIALSDLGDPSIIDSIDINVLTTDSSSVTTYDSLNNGYFYINTDYGSKKDIIDSPDDSEDGGVDYDIVNVTAEITTP